MSTEIMRSSETIAAEINFLKVQTANGIVEIGKRLIEAQELLGEGESFTDWLTEKVDFSRRTAYNFMRVAKEFNDVQALARLGQTKIFQLLEVAENEREEFMNSTHEVNGIQKTVDEMSTRELQKVIKEKEEVLKRYNEAQTQANELRDSNNSLQSDLRTKEQAIKDAKADIKELQDELKEKTKDLKSEKDKLAERCRELQRKLDEAEKNNDDEAAEELQEQLEDQRKDNEELQKKIDELTAQLSNPVNIEPVVVEKNVVPEEVIEELEHLKRSNEEAEKLISKLQKQANSSVERFKFQFEALKDSFAKTINTLSEVDEEQQENCRKALRALFTKMDSSI